jgi:hypothetical protein
MPYASTELFCFALLPVLQGFTDGVMTVGPYAGRKVGAVMEMYFKT